MKSGLEGEVVLEGVRYEMGEGHLEPLNRGIRVEGRRYRAVGEAMTLIASYFAVISLASSLFFNQVEAWHGPSQVLPNLLEVDQRRLKQ